MNNQFTRLLAVSAVVLVSSMALVACNGSSSSSSSGGTGGGGGGNTTTGRTFTVRSGDNATPDMIAAMIQAAPGDIIQFGCGYYELTSSLQLTNTEDVLIKGCGKDKTVLSFKNTNTQEGILAVNVHGVTIQDLTVLDTAGNGIEFRGVDHGTIQRVRAMWSSNGGRQSPDPINATNYTQRLNVPCTDPATQDPTAPENALGDISSPDYTVSPKSGRYGIYPVSSENILIEDSESIGASDAGIYVGQTNNAIIRRSRAAFNVFGLEIENVRGGEYDTNIAECNTGGFLIYDLDNLRQYGDRSLMHGNISRNNNTYNFTSGGFVGNVPPGSGMITLAYDRIDIFDNIFENNNTAGIIHTSYEVFPEGAGRPEEKRIDWYTEGLHIFRNKFINNGNHLPLPTSNDLINQNLAHLLPTLVGVKNLAGCLLPPTNLPGCLAGLTLPYRGAHILWDGLLDNYDAACPRPKDKNGNLVPVDSRGKPQHTNEDPNPACHYNAYKFNTAAQGAPRIKPDWWSSCIDDDNQFSSDSLAFANFHGTKGLEVLVNSTINPADPVGSVISIVSALDVPALTLLAADFNIAPHKCLTAYGKNLPPLSPVVIPPFVRSGDFDPAPSDAQVAALCNASTPAGQVNANAAKVNCPTLDSYHLFSNPQDPTSAPNGRGVPFVLNTKLFSDYAVKYRVLYLPTGTQAIYKDSRAGGGTANTTILFPTGTIIAKTFSFSNKPANTEVPMETRLLIKRANSKGATRWDGIPYIWETDGTGKRIAKLALGGATRAASWDYIDADSQVHHQGSTQTYLIPHGNQCLSCHSNEDKEPGSSPIGTKVRFLNRPYRSESAFVTDQGRHEVLGKNQIQYWCQKGLMSGCPADLGVDPSTQIANKLERIPTFNKPGDSGQVAGSARDIEDRARAWLEVNCEHCHNVRGFAASTGYYLDSLRPVDTTYGICKHPTATGHEGSNGRTVDIHPADASQSILEFRISSGATSPAARMPPIARSVVDEEGHALIEQWINTVVTADEAKYPGSTSCAGN